MTTEVHMYYCNVLSHHTMALMPHKNKSSVQATTWKMLRKLKEFYTKTWQCFKSALSLNQLCNAIDWLTNNNIHILVLKIFTKYLHQSRFNKNNQTKQLYNNLQYIKLTKTYCKHLYLYAKTLILIFKSFHLFD